MWISKYSQHCQCSCIRIAYKIHSKNCEGNSAYCINICANLKRIGWYLQPLTRSKQTQIQALFSFFLTVWTDVSEIINKYGLYVYIYESVQGFMFLKWNSYTVYTNKQKCLLFAVQHVTHISTPFCLVLSLSHTK